MWDFVTGGKGSLVSGAGDAALSPASEGSREGIMGRDFEILNSKSRYVSGERETGEVMWSSSFDDAG